ncbi:type I restriction-modification system subunit M [Lactobacillus sp. LC28-10]|uniref:site-specific DNA-methyltransferase (adenine-specific) n=1 Tax=Secundilactobacillus angelensis TaxID=2722706 RepID=A0ABX1KYT8_9LACO|nr:type I restriction-modification system subunit M [Secundilactobacillus angelensis]MCH5462738.1 type I restriction-modification system subunit M [Secundilactobacillus angelensis]NLR19108.1 type I restriction-modification system subunit M [Secundilactobacillus angelensis]
MTETTELQSGLFSAADVLRSKMDANEYKNYLLGTVFYKYLSDSMLYYAAELEGKEKASLEEAQKIYEDNATDSDLIDELKDTFGYVIQPESTYTNILKSVDDHSFQLNQLGDAFTKLESFGAEFEGLFDDYDLYSKRLGNNAQKQADTIAGVLSAIGKLELVKTAGDSLGDAYEYLIGQFASESGKKAGEFYTPQKVSELLSRLTLVGKNYKDGMTVYDPAMGSGSLLLNFKKYSDAADRITYFGQEINTSTFNLARMNMILHHVDIASQHLRNGDTLDEDWPAEEVTNFDSVVMNPPYSLKWSAADGFKEDPRFSAYGVLPPKSKADYAFLLHGYYHLKYSGAMAIVLPHGVLFRGAAEGKIRQKMLESGAIDAVIGLPANLFYNTSIPTAIVVLKKDKQDRNVMFIDASKNFEKAKTQNILREKDVQRILDTYEKREDVDKFAHLATFDEIQENEFNLNIPRYVDTFEPEPEIDLKQVAYDLRQTSQEIKENEHSLVSMLKDLTSDDDNIMDGLNDVIKDLEDAD